MQGRFTIQPRVLYPLKIFLVAATYFILARMSLLLSFQTSNASPIWPPSGFAFAMILLLGYRIAPGILIGAFAANFVVFQLEHDATMVTALWVSFVIGIGNTLEAIVGYLLFKRLVPEVKDNSYFSKVNHIFYFFTVAIIMSLVGASVGTASIYLGSFINTDQQLIVWLTWWFGDVSGILLITPFILIWLNFFRKRPRSAFRSTRIIETAALFMLVILTSEVVFNNWFSPLFIFKWAFWIIPVVVWAATRFTQRESITAVILCSAIAIWGTLNGHGPFAIPSDALPGDVSLNQSLLITQAYISIIGITTLALNASIVERKRTEEELRELGTELERRVSERTAELTRTNKELESFTFVASHDLQEPLRKIRIFLNLIGEREMPQLSETSKNYLNRTVTTATQMQKFITDLLAYSRADAPEHLFQKTDLNLIIQKVQTDLKENIEEKKATIETNRLPELNVIPFQFEQLFTNMISNALKFSKPHVPPHIIIRSEIVTGKIGGHNHTSPHMKYYCLSISDNGIGFETKYNEKIFDLFQRLHSRSDYDGTGIGLSICKKIVENHKGFITADGNPGKGVNFNIYLPF